MEKLTLALDWTPNVNHIGILIAKEKEFFLKEGIDLSILDPAVDNYAITPGKKLEMGFADLAIAPMESVISLNNKVNPVDAIAVYAILQEDLSSIVTLKSSGLNRPAAIAGKRYASYKARYEDHIVQAMIKNDGGMQPVECIYPEKLGIWNTLLTGKADATWIFDNWEGVEATTQGIELNHFHLANFNIPYGYSPIIMARKKAINTNFALYKKAISAIQKGYAFAKVNPDQAVEILSFYITPVYHKQIDLPKTIQRTIPYLGLDGHMGKMDAGRVKLFLNWLVQQNLESEKILSQTFFTNEFLNS